MWKKIAQFFKNVAWTVSKPKKAKISTTKFNLKAQNIYIKPLLKSWNTYNKPCFETAYLGENAINLHAMSAFLWATSSFQKITMSLQKAQLKKITQSGHPESNSNWKSAALIIQVFTNKNVLLLHHRDVHSQGILKGEVSLYRWPPVWLVWISLFCK
jgi:hypothetical protein